MQDKKRAKFIVIEGLEGAGKSTALQFIRTFLENKQIDVINTREPGGTFIAEKLRQILLTSFKNETLLSKSELLIMYAARIQHLETLIFPELKKGNWVISDRFNWSSFAYQGGGRQLAFDMIKYLDNLVLKSFMPDMIIYLDVTPEIGLMRARNRNNLDRIEQEKIDFFNRARAVFLRLISENPQSSVLIDAEQPINRIQDELAQVLSNI